MYLCKYTVLFSHLDKYWFKYYYMYMFKYLLKEAYRDIPNCIPERPQANACAVRLVSPVSGPSGRHSQELVYLLRQRDLRPGRRTVPSVPKGEKRMKYESPCLTCTRVRDPKNCEAKTCRDWQAWFIDRWEAMRECVRKDMAQAQLREVGVPLGGHHYAPPHQVTAYLRHDPCDTCPALRCAQPCPVKKAWRVQKGAAK